MQKIILTLTILATFILVAINLNAEQAILFYSLSGSNTLTQEDVNKILDAEWIEGENFTAKIHTDITAIFSSAFSGNKYLLKVFGQNVTGIGAHAFLSCSKLTLIDFPIVSNMDHFNPYGTPNYGPTFAAFSECYSLDTVIFGTGFTEPTEIEFGDEIFGVAGFSNDLSKQINLILGEYVLPKPNLNKRTWQNCYAYYKKDYIWKTITIYVGIEEETKDEINIYSIGNNIYYIGNDDILDFELYDLTGKKIMTFDSQQKIIDLNDIKIAGTYFLCYARKSKLITYKILIY